MKILLGMHHPKHFWMFKYLIQEGTKRGWEFKILISQKDILEDLLKSAGLKYEIIGKNQPTLFKKSIEMLKWVIKTLKYSKEFNPDFYIGQAFPHFSLPSALHKKPFFILEDTESVKWLHVFTIPFSDLIITPNYFQRDFGKKQLRINSYFELAYLHPNFYKPDSTILQELGVNKEDKYIIIRFVSWKASHDIGQTGFSYDKKIELIKEIEKYAIPFLTSEDELPKELKKYQIKIPPHLIHDAIYNANMFIGEGATMAAEAAILGTPSILIHPMAEILGNMKELGDKFKILINIRKYDINLILKKIKEIIIKKNKWKQKQKTMLKNKIDMTSFMLWFIQKYPNSKEIIKKDPDFQWQFK